jgi:hypothetical protein
MSQKPASPAHRVLIVLEAQLTSFQKKYAPTMYTNATHVALNNYALIIQKKETSTRRAHTKVDLGQQSY